MKSFNHSAIAALPEYHAARKALNDLAGAIKRGDAGPAWLEVVHEIAESTPYADSCDKCFDYCWPLTADVENGQLRGTYRCARGHVWTCEYAVRVSEKS